MSVGHVQRGFEAAGIATVSVYVRAFGHLPGLMGLSRSAIVDHPMGRPLGGPGDADRQREVVEFALGLLDRSEQTIVDYPHPYRRPGI